MTRHRWHVQRSADRLILARHWPPRFDVVAETVLPYAPALPLAHQIRQDMWRAMQDVRGFSPVVQLTRDGDTWAVCAGGRVMKPVAASLATKVQDLLHNPDLRDRWHRFAARKASTSN